jgi:predicted outer membrane repeat protein
MNSAVDTGGGIYTYASGLNTLTNCTFAWNSAGTGGGIYGGGTTTIRNSIFYFDSALQEIYKHSGTMTIIFSNIMGGYTGEGNIDKHPEFVTGGDFHLSALSPCIDTASPVNAPEIDIDDELRPHGAGYDMGADEFDGIPVTPPPPPSKADLNEDGVVDGLDVSIFATEFGKIY